ncbi:MAG: OmpH family outer membrane protein [Puniceicoccales bacterium]|nr:OmpH family outer membrane protein [Puniceicoccales bacterium]
MRKLVVFLCVVGLGAVRLSALDFGTPKVPSVSVSSASWNGKIAVVHFTKIKDEYHRVKELNETLAKNVEAVQKELLSMVSDFEKAGKEYRELVDKAANPALTDEAKKKIKAEADDKLMILQQKENALLDFKTNSEKRITKIGSEESAKILTTVRQKAGEVAKEQGFSIVLDADNPMVIYSEDSLDITDSVLKALNADQPKPVVAVPVTPAAASVKK